MLSLYIHLEKDSMPYFSVSMPYFVVWILWFELRIYSQGVRFFDKFENIIHMSSGDKPILTLKISFINFGRFRYFADFDIRIVLLGQNSFE